MRARSKIFTDKAVGAMLAAIEIYNKPAFPYREDTFAVLAINAWELLFKARLLQINGNRIACIQVYEKHQNADGTLSSREYVKFARSGNPMTIGMFRAYDLLVSEHADTVDPLVRKNLEALTEIRDNSVHFINSDIRIAKRVQEIGTATLKNFLSLCRQWFGRSLSEYNFYLMPLAFFRENQQSSVVSLTNYEKNFVELISVLQTESTDDEASDFNFTLAMDVKLKRVGADEQALVTVGSAPNSVKITLAEEDIRDRFPWDYAILNARLSKRYTDFKVNNNYHSIRKPLMKDSRYCDTRYLDPGNPRSAKKTYYNPNILKEFDNHYTKA
ncbi:MAG TPA: DUF3644 domain-containing protein [Verrucomicrobia bacterium]|nr:DUF3644 domain-containing protein [Verrucomicrobiota bacterium]